MKSTVPSIVGVAAFLLTIGCAAPKPPAHSTDAPQSSSVPALADIQPQIAPNEEVFNAPDALARKAQDFSREVEPHLTRRSPEAAAEPSIPSQVQWSDPSNFTLGHAPTAGTETTTLQMGDVSSAAIRTAPSEANVVADAVAVEPATEPGAVTAAANAPAPAEFAPVRAGAGSPAGAAGVLAEKLASRIRDYPRDVAGHLEYQLLQFLLDEQVPELAALASLPSEDRELLSAVLDGLSLFRSTLRSDNNMLLSAKIRPLVEMANRLKSQADLTIPTVTLCRSVAGFGKYEPIEPARFTAGIEHRAILYCEVANFSSVLNDQRLWETKLKQELVLYTELFGAAVWEDKSETILDTARNRRHDFFVNKRIVIPGNLAVGRYLLKVSIVDLHGNRVAEASVPIVIVAQ